jgi:hypothetical protein
VAVSGSLFGEDERNRKPRNVYRFEKYVLLFFNTTLRCFPDLLKSSEETPPRDEISGAGRESVPEAIRRLK